MSLTNCTLTANSADPPVGEGGAIAVKTGTSLTITNCIIWANNPDQIDDGTGLVTVDYSDVQGGWPGIGNIDADPEFAPGAGNLRLFYGSPCIDAADTTDVPLDQFDVDDDLEFGELTPDLDLRDRAIDDPDTADSGIGAPPVDMGSYEFAPCPSDVNRDCVVNVLDLIDLLLCFGQPAVPGCEAEDINGDGVVNVDDLIDLLLDFGTNCSCADPEAQPQSLEEALEEAGLDEDDWDDFMDIMEEGTQEEKDNWHCWMTHYLSCHDGPFGTCNPPPPNCPGSDPFDGHRH